MAFPTIIDSIISKGSVNVARQGFGTPLLMHYTTKFVPRVISISSAQELIDTYGFDSAASVDFKDYVFINKVQQIFAQNPSPAVLKIGRRATAPVQALKFTVASSPAPAQGDVYKLSLGGPASGTGTYEITYTAGAAPTPTSVATALTALINAATVGGTATSAAAVITIAPLVSGELHMFSDWSSNLSFRDDTPDAGIAADLAACLLEDPDFFGIDLVSDGEAEVKAAAAWCEVNKRMFFPTSADTEILSSIVTNDVASELKALNLNYTACYFDKNNTHSALGLALFAKLGAEFAPGAETSAHKSLSLIPVSKLNTSQTAALEGKNCNFFSNYLGLPITWKGKVASGEWVDVTRAIEWVNAELKASVFESIAGANGKLPYTDAGIAVIEGAIRGVLARAVSLGALAADPAATVTVPKANSLSSAQRATRILPDVKWTAQLAGAIHEVIIRGTVSA